MFGPPGASLDNQYQLPRRESLPGPFHLWPWRVPCRRPVLADASQSAATPGVQWNLAIQRQVSKQWFASATYLGNHGLHETNQIELNPAILVGGVCDPSLAGTNPAVYFGLTTPTCSSPNNVNARRILNLQNPVKAAGISNLTAYDNGATSDYNGILLSTTYQFNSNFNFNANYTWSHCVGDLSIGDQVPNPGHNTPNDYVGGNRRLDRGNCFSDIRHIFNLTAWPNRPTTPGHFLAAWQATGGCR